MLHKSIRELRDMHESILVHTDIDERTEIHDISNRSLKLHLRLQIIEIEHIRAKHRCRYILPRVTSRSDQLLHDILERIDTNLQLLCQCRNRALRRLQLRRQLRILPTLKILLRISHRCEKCLRNSIAFWMHRCVIQCFLSIPYPQEAGALLVCLRAELRHLQELLTRGKSALLLAVGDDVSCDGLIDARHIRQEREACGVHIDTDAVDAVLDDTRQLLTQLRLVHIMLILSDTDRLRIDLNKLCQRILQPSRHRGRRALPYIEIRELLCRKCGRRIDRRTRLVHDHILHWQMILLYIICDDLLGFTGGCTIAE